MICADQIPDEVADAIRHCFHTRGAAKAEIAAALAAWPGMGPIRTDQPIGDWCDKLPAIILPLPQENPDAEA